jgi:hypothetical protein
MPAYKKTYRISEALPLLAKHGYEHPSINSCYREDDRVVAILQDWTPKGKDIARLVLAHGKYKGQDVGVVFRDKQDYK